MDIKLEGTFILIMVKTYNICYYIHLLTPETLKQKPLVAEIG